MAIVKEGDTIRIYYTGRLEDGSVFDCCTHGKPLEFTVGEGEIVQGLEQGVVGMSPGETKAISVPAELGYGPRLEERIFQMPRDRFPGDFAPEIGQSLQMYRADGMPVVVTVCGLTDTHLTMDGNPPLAGKTMIFDTTLVEIVQDQPR